MSRIGRIDMYCRSNLFNYLTENELEIVMDRFRSIKQAQAPTDTTFSATPNTADGPSVRTVEGPPKKTMPSQTADEYVMSGRLIVLEALGKLCSTAEEANLCLYCGSTGHEHFVCQNPGKDGIKNALNVLRSCMMVVSETTADMSMDDAFASGHHVDAAVAFAGCLDCLNQV